ncbi:ribonuclease E/G [Paracoccus denitrificans]|jgi:Ribonuclease G/E|uniref:Ribonuclease n=1 Tax=Paracoccus denitrificans (strain Pd 1222) TaxID=318586 RepID=A1B2Z5_PARDP|nr:ribonuclease E/G [Paracoccus denitrificans]ABL69889.1 ribonuclease [Paracoccus denitrificans PD1222]MBB4626970.1 Ribonuclease G/E [Paracoccus denitrificans]MCU7428356.1 ribonuclease E/G [Paracoccus denitrificans]QAR25280.1 ribonuclease G [Paracoccus denitrificans]UPV94163.1 ribonuclease E/G [Paracoccus denitrificans]
MKGRQIVLGRIFGRNAAALMQDGRLEDLVVDPAGATPLAPGAICRAKVDRLVKGQGGVFLRLPEGARGFLRDRSGLREGQSLLVQVNGSAEDGKAVPVSARLNFRGRHVIVTPGAPGVNVSRRIRDSALRDALTRLGEAALEGLEDPPGIVFRSIAATAGSDGIAAELEQLLELAQAVTADHQGAPELLLDAPEPADQAWQDWADPPPDSVEDGDDAFEATGAEAAVLQMLHPRLDLGGGAWAEIEALRALVAIDVNTGSDHSPAAGLKANIALARDLPRQLRLRGLGGQIVIDFAPMPKRDRGTLEQVLRAAFRSESAETVLIGWTAMGLYELSRKRDRILLARLAGTGADA